MQTRNIDSTEEIIQINMKLENGKPFRMLYRKNDPDFQKILSDTNSNVHHYLSGKEISINPEHNEFVFTREQFIILTIEAVKNIRREFDEDAIPTMTMERIGNLVIEQFDRRTAQKFV